MPDFAQNKPGKKAAKASTPPRREDKKLAERKVLESGKAGKLPPAQGRPHQALEGLLKDFQGGIRALNGLLSQKPQEARKSQTEGSVKVVRVPSSTHTEKTTTKYMVTSNPSAPAAVSKDGQRMAKVWTKANEIRDKGFDVAAAAAIEESNIRVPSSVISNKPSTPLRRKRRVFPVISGADKEAYKQVFEAHKGDSPHHIPSAARLAQILRADALLKSGSGQPNPQIHSMAQAVREGRRREVADIDPERVQRILHEALGGAHKAQQLLNSPSINRMIERHNSLVRTVHTQREQNERTREVLTGSGASLKARFKSEERGRLPESTTSAAPASRASEPGFARRWDAQPITGEKHHEAELLDMLANNEAQHINQMSSDGGESDERPLAGVASEMARSARTGDRVMNGVGGGGSSSSRSSPMAFGNNPPPTPPVLPFSSGSAPKGNAPQAVAAAMTGSPGGGGSSKRSPQKITGTMKIMNPNGQAGSEAQINGTLS